MINNSNSNRYIPLELSESLKKENVVSEFFYDKTTNSVKIVLNHQMERTDIILSIDKKNWQKSGEELTKSLKRKGINNKNLVHLLGINLDNNWQKIIGIDDHNNKHDNNDDNLNRNDNFTVSDLSDLSDQTKNNNNSDNFKNQIDQQQQKKIPLLSVLDAKRSSEGLKKVTGRIVGRSTTFRVISKTEWRCQNSECDNADSSIYNPPLLCPLPQLDNTKSINPSCFKCGKYCSLKVFHEYRNAKIIQLDDINTIEEKFDRLDVILYDDASNKIIDSEIVEIEGVLYTQKKISSSSRTSNSSKLVNILHSDKTIVYKNKKEIKNTQKDIEIFYKWKKICKDAYKKELEILHRFKNIKREDRPEWVKKIKPMTFEQRVVAMFAPNVYGHADAKIGILRSLMRGNKSENGADNGRRGRIHTLLIGEPGNAKTSLAEESTKLDFNSRMVDATGASGKSLVGIVDKENDSTMVKYGVVVTAKNSHVVINEVGSMSPEDQWRLVGIAEEGKTSLDKWGEHIPIDASTTLILTANPQGTKWNSSKMSSDKMVVIRPNLLDRIDQIYGFFDAQTEEELEEFIEEITKIKNRKPHNYNFLIKYIQYVKTIEPKWVGNAEKRLNRFWINAKLQGIAGNRSFFSIKRIAEAQAKLNLSFEIDDIIANKTMHSLQLMFLQYGKVIEKIQNPRDLTVEVFYSILKENNKTGYTVKELCKKGSEKNKQVREYLKNKWNLDDNKELRTIIDMLEHKQGIKIKSLKPIVLQYSDDISENDKNTSDPYNTSDQHYNNSLDKNIENFYKDTQIDETDRSDRSDSKEEYISDTKLVNIDGNKKGKPIEMTKEQYDSWAGNENKNEI